MQWPLHLVVLVSTVIAACTNFGHCTAAEEPKACGTASGPSVSRKSIYVDIQASVTTALGRGAQAANAVEAAAIVVEVESAKIRALASTPSLSRSNVVGSPSETDSELSRLTGVSFPMGGLITPLLVAHSIESGIIRPETIFDVRGPLVVGTLQVMDARTEAYLSTAEIVVKSSNVGSAKIALMSPLEDLGNDLGFDETLVVAGSTAQSTATSGDLSHWSSEMRAMPGAVVQANLLQAIAAYLPIANGGIRRQLSVDELQEGARANQIYSPETAAKVRAMLERAASPEGTAPEAMVSGLRVAGKSSTLAQHCPHIICGREAGSQDGSLIVTFVGMVPVERPQWLVGVMMRMRSIDPPLYSGDTAAPIFAEIVGGLRRAQFANDE